MDASSAFLLWLSSLPVTMMLALSLYGWDLFHDEPPTLVDHIKGRKRKKEFLKEIEIFKKKLKSLMK